MRPTHEEDSSWLANCASLQDLHRVWGDLPGATTAKQLRELASRWTQRPRFVGIRLQELFGGLQLAHDEDYVLALIGHLGGRHEQAVRLFMLRHDHCAASRRFTSAPTAWCCWCRPATPWPATTK